MAARLCLLGFSGSTLSMIFSTLKDLGESCELAIIENLRTSDAVPYDCGLPHRRIWHEEFRPAVDDRFLLAVGAGPAKQKVSDFFASRYALAKEQFINLVHPSAQVGADVRLQQGVRVEPGCVLAPFSSAGFSVTILRGVGIGHHTVLEDFVTVGPGVHVGGHSHVGHGTFLGIGAIVSDHVKIGPDSIIGAGSVVLRDIPSGVVAYGNPCKVIRKNT